VLKLQVIFRIFSVLMCLLAVNDVWAQAPEIIVSGADKELETNIRQHLRIADNEACDVPLVRFQRLRSQVEDNIGQAGEALGYYRMSSELSCVVEKSCWQLTLDVTPGERIPVSKVSVRLPDDPALADTFGEIVDEAGALEGKPLDHGRYESIKNALSASAVENGYFSAQFLESTISLDLAAYHAAIALDFDPGPRYRFGVIRVLPVDGFSQRFLDRLIILQTGMPYSSSALLEQRTKLDESQYFRQVSISPQLARADNLSVPVIIELGPRFRHAWSTGVGFTTDTGPRLRASYDNRYINSRGHHLESDASVSRVRSLVNLGYTIPLKDPLTTNVSLKTGYITENTDVFDSDRYKLETAFNRESSSGWLESYSVDYLRDDYIIDQQADVSTLTMLGYSLTKTAGDDFINPSRGWRLFGQLRGASGSLLSDTSFLQLYTSVKGVISFGKSRFITRFEAGTTVIDNATELPASVRFFAGGDRSLRGYDYKSLGPENDNGEVVGGKHLLVGSVEYDYLVKNNWRTAIFYGAGNAFSTHDFSWRHSVGIGFRWMSPIGPIRADLAHPLEGSGVRLHITMGPDL